MSEREALWTFLPRWMARHFTRGQILAIRRASQVIFWLLVVSWIVVFLHG